MFIIVSAAGRDARHKEKMLLSRARIMKSSTAKSIRRVMVMNLIQVFDVVFASLTSSLTTTVVVCCDCCPYSLRSSLAREVPRFFG
jgi:hypothetical protein